VDFVAEFSCAHEGQTDWVWFFVGRLLILISLFDVLSLHYCVFALHTLSVTPCKKTMTALLCHIWSNLLLTRNYAVICN
jgi:hypothetical protein